FGGRTVLRMAQAMGERAVVKLLRQAAAAAPPPSEEPSAPRPPGTAPANRAAWKRLLHHIAERCGQVPRRLSKPRGAYRVWLGIPSHDEGEETNPDILRFRPPQPTGPVDVEQLQTECLAAGFLMIRTQLNPESDAVELLLFPTNDPYAVIAA